MFETDEQKDEKYTKALKSKWKQNEVPYFRLKPTLLSTTITFFSFGTVLLIFGSIVIDFANKVLEVTIDYTDCPLNSPCNKTFEIDKDYNKDFIFTYQIDDFYQNMRNYIISKSDEQLFGKAIDKSTLDSNQQCLGGMTNKEMGIEFSINGTSLNPDDVAIPCGLMAKSFFRDTFRLYDENDKLIPINEKNIAWQNDQENYKNIGDDWKAKQWLDMTDEHFLVWMRPSAFSTFRKLWGTINFDLKKGKYTVCIINNSYDVSTFNGAKKIVISKMNSFGGKNIYLGIYYLVIGCGCVLISIGIFFGYKLYIRKRAGLPAEEEVDDQEIF